MEALRAGTKLDPGDIVAPGATPGSPLELGPVLVEYPHGVAHRSRQDGVPVLVTVVDPVFIADPGVLTGLRGDLDAAATRTHRGLLPLHGVGRPDRLLLLVEHDPGGTTMREFIAHRIARGRPLDAEAAYTLIGHLCHALGALHPDVIHGYVNADTTHISESGRVFLSSQTIGRYLARSPGFARHKQSGQLPNIAPEQLLSTPQLSPGTDVFALGSLFVEMVTGRSLTEAGQPIQALGLVGPPDVLMCLERATAPSPTARPPDVETFRDELTEALREGPLERHAPSSRPIPPPPPSALPVPHQGPADRGPRRPPRPPPPPRPRVRTAPPPTASASSSLLGLSLKNIATVEHRLSTIDGVSDAAIRQPVVPPVNNAPALDTSRPDSGLDTSRDGPAYFLLRDGALDGPLPFARISERAANGSLSLDDRVQDRTNGLEHPIASIPVLRRLLETAEERKELLRFSQHRAEPRHGPAPAPPPRRATPPKDRRTLHTALWVLVVLVGFAGAAWWLDAS